MRGIKKARSPLSDEVNVCVLHGGRLDPWHMKTITKLSQRVFSAGTHGSSAA